eukprot:757944-Hanusia_phi.AAC.6
MHPSEVRRCKSVIRHLLVNLNPSPSSNSCLHAACLPSPPGALHACRCCAISGSRTTDHPYPLRLPTHSMLLLSLSHYPHQNHEMIVVAGVGGGAQVVMGGTG